MYFDRAVRLPNNLRESVQNALAERDEPPCLKLSANVRLGREAFKFRASGLQQLPDRRARGCLSDLDKVGNSASLRLAERPLVGHVEQLSRVHVVKINPAARALHNHDPGHDRQHQLMKALQPIVKVREDSRRAGGPARPQPAKVMRAASSAVTGRRETDPTGAAVAVSY